MGAGAVTRRTGPALDVTLAGFIAARFMITELVRPHYMTAITTTGTSPQVPPGSWQLAQGMIGPGGKVLPPDGSTCTSGCVPPGYRAFLTYQPASRSLAVQGREHSPLVAPP